MRTKNFIYFLLLVISTILIGCSENPSNSTKEVVQTDTIPKKKEKVPIDAISTQYSGVFGPHHPEWGESSLSVYLKRTNENKISGSVVVRMRNPDTKTLCQDKYLTNIAIVLAAVNITFPEGLVESVLNEKDFVLGRNIDVTQITSKKIVDQVPIADEMTYDIRWEFTLDSDPKRGE